MKYMKRARVFKATNVVFDPNEIHATSYDWWVFVKRIKGKTVFNDYGYSNTTRRHQWKVRSLMRELGITIDVEIEAPKGLQRLDTAVDHYKYKIEELEQAIAKPRSKRVKNAERFEAIERFKTKIREVKRLEGRRA